MTDNEWKWRHLDQLRRWNQMLGDVVRKQQELNRLVLSDPFVANSLVRCGVDYPTMFCLLWGATLQATDERFPEKLRKSVLSVLEAMSKKEECYDSQEKKLHDIIIECSYALYEKEVNNVVERTMAGQSNTKF